ncbi:MAG: purine-nucleoside phosphorylase [Spirochaetaceae bacterium]|jgi:purine-nucleoside phosphorylase|nr:purine-nucleoside phosphorylase [Spirochaetaceae bacterium]
MSIHIAAKNGDIAPLVLLPGDPLRAKFIAENFLQDARCYSTVRNMLGFTGLYKGERVSVQGTGMGVPSLSIYVTELFADYGIQKAIRIGTAGSVQTDVKVRDLVLATSACTDSGANTLRFGGKSFAPAADFALLHKAYHLAEERGIKARPGSVFTSDVFYNDHDDDWKLWARFGVLAIDMETAELYTLAAKHGRQALSILTISDSILTGESTTSEERETSFAHMMEVALETIL